MSLRGEKNTPSTCPDQTDLSPQAPVPVPNHPTTHPPPPFPAFPSYLHLPLYLPHPRHLRMTSKLRTLCTLFLGDPILPLFTPTELFPYLSQKHRLCTTKTYNRESDRGRIVGELNTAIDRIRQKVEVVDVLAVCPAGRRFLYGERWGMRSEGFRGEIVRALVGVVGGELERVVGGVEREARRLAVGIYRLEGLRMERWDPWYDY